MSFQMDTRKTLEGILAFFLKDISIFQEINDISKKKKKKKKKTNYVLKTRLKTQKNRRTIKGTTITKNKKIKKK